MNTRTLAFCLACLVTSHIQVFSAGYEKDRENWLPALKEIYGDEQPSVKQSDTIDNVRELKYPGQRYIHMGDVQLQGRGKLVKKHKYWFDTEKFVQLTHASAFIILEEIISTEEELDDGIIKSLFTVQRFDEQLVSAKAGYKLGFVTTNDILKGLRNFRKNHGTSIIDLGDELIKLSAAAAAATATAAVAPEPVATKVGAGVTATTAVTLFSIGVGLKAGVWALEKIDAKTDDDGNWILTDDAIKDLYPEVDMIIQKLHHLEGTTIESTWVAQNGKRDPKEIGYTQLHISSKNTSITEEDKEMLAKMIYRANPFGVKTVLPEDKKGIGNVWEINANDVISWLTTAGINYDTVNGTIRVKDFGSSQTTKYDDENSLQQKDEVTVTTLKAITKDNDRLRFMKKLKDTSQVKISVIPTSGEIIVVDPKVGEDAPKYVKEVNVEGRIESHIDKPTGLLTDIVYEENSVLIHYAYTQLRMPAKAGNKTAPSGASLKKSH